MLAPSRASRVPTASSASPLRLHAAIAVTVRSGSKRSMRASSASHRSPTSRVTASNTSVVGTACATSVATRRSAACSSASPPSSFCACSASWARNRASRARSCARRASSLTTYAVTSAITRAAAISDSAMWKLCNGELKKNANVRKDATATTPAITKPQPIATGRIAKRYKPVRPSGSANRLSAAIRTLTTAIATAPVIRPVAVRRKANPRPVMPDLPELRLPRANVQGAYVLRWPTPGRYGHPLPAEMVQI